ncbi:MAG: 50S ribosomal protein L29 [Gammaproteobacteria bacterium]|nr:MAG: 50S ribosomal protein L29 [Gammaproteobacteria bacterium]
MKASELKQKSREDLHAMLLELLDEQFKLRMQKSMGQVSNTHRFGEIRKDIARIKTVLNQA